MAESFHELEGIVSHLLPALSQLHVGGLPVGEAIHIAHIAIPICKILAIKIKYMRDERRRLRNSVESRILAHEILIEEKRLEIYEEITKISKKLAKLTEEDIPAVRQELAILGEKLIYLEKLELELEKKKDAIRKNLFSRFSTLKTSRWLKDELKKIDEYEDKIQLEKVHIEVIIQQVEKHVEEREWRGHPQAARLVEIIRKLFAKLENLEIIEEKEELVEEKYEQ